jgi:hypothetical protein
VYCERNAATIAGWKANETDSAKGFTTSEGELKFAVDTGKVNTLEKGWRDLALAVVQKRPTGPVATPEEWQTRELPVASARVMWADIAASMRFHANWKTRFEQLGAGEMANVHVLGDGASWIWMSADRTLTDCGQTLDIYRVCEHLADAGKKLFGEGTPAATTFFERGRSLILHEGWTGICRLMGDEYEREDIPSVREVLEPMTRYFAAHIGRRNYWACLAAGKSIGSGVVEGAAKTLGLRLKARGARWKNKKARAMAALVRARSGDEWLCFWNKAG